MLKARKIVEKINEHQVFAYGNTLQSPLDGFVQHLPYNLCAVLP